MNLKRKALLMLALMMVVSTLFAGCVMLPEEYTKGVKLDRSYPKSDMPIMDDAVIYYCESEDDSVSVKYGVKDDLDDVADFYKDFFKDNDIVLESETDKSTRYAADGSYKDFNFKIKATEPSGEYEVKVFKTVVKVDIEFIDDSLGAVSDLQSLIPLKERILGFWRQESFDDGSGQIATFDYGVAYEFLSDGSLDLYFDFSDVGTGGWEEVNNLTVLLTAIDGAQENVSVAFEKRSEKDYLIWKDSTGTLVFYRDSSAEFEYNNLSEDLTGDEELEDAVSGKIWYYIHYREASGNTQSNSSGSLIYYKDGSLKDTFDDETIYGSWYVSAGRLYCNYSDNTSVNWMIDVLYENNTSYLYYYSDSEAGAYWLYASVPRDILFGVSMQQYTSDADMTSAILGYTFHELYYIFPDGSFEEMSNNSMTFNYNNLFEDNYEGTYYKGTWKFSNGYLELDYEDGSKYHYPAYVEYSSDSGQYYLYLGDLEEGYEGCYWVFTTFQP